MMKRRLMLVGVLSAILTVANVYGQGTSPSAQTLQTLKKGSAVSRFAGAKVLYSAEGDESASVKQVSKVVRVKNFKYSLIRIEECSTSVKNAASQGNSSVEMVADHMIVKLKKGASKKMLENICSQKGFSIRKQVKGTKDLFLVSFNVNHANSLISAIGEMKKESGTVEYAEPDYIRHASLLPDDPKYQDGTLWGMDKISAPSAWDINTGSKAVLVGVIDTGIDYNHEDLAANVWTNPGEIPANGIDDDGNGFIDDVHGWDAANGDGDPMDDHGHGTHCSGTIGGVGNNGIAIAGVNWNVSIIGLKFLDAGGSGATSDAVTCVNYATKMNADITSNSWGGGGYDQSLYDAIAANGKIFSAAAGNSGTDNDVTPNYPSNYDLDNIIAVAATDSNDDLAYFSCYGLTSVDLAAPGVGIYSSLPGNSYDAWDGTSMATPHVSGTVALLLAADNALSPAQIKSFILDNADPVPALDGKCVTGARLNVFKALQSVKFISVLSPAGGEVWKSGETMDITWASNGFAGNVAIELWKGGAYDSDIAPDEANDGTYSWAIPSEIANATDYRIKISSIEDPTISGESSSDFAINDVVYTLNMLVSPDGTGTTDPSGSRGVLPATDYSISATPKAGYYFIEWTPSANALVDDVASADTTVQLSGDADVTANFDIFYVTLSMAVYPDASAGSTDPADPTVIPSAQPFEITAHPNAGFAFVAWTVDDGNATIDSPNCSAANATLLSDATIAAHFAQVTALEKDISAVGTTAGGNQYFTFEVPDGMQEVKIWTSGTSGDILDLGVNLPSTGYFPPTTLDSDSGEQGYTYSGDETVYFNGSPVEPGTYYILVEKYDVGGDFTITATYSDISTRFITVLTPNGGESYTQADVCPITWESLDAGAEIILTVFLDDEPYASGQFENTGEFLWQINSDFPPSDYYKVQISSVDGAISDMSDGYFSITPPPPAQLTIAENIDGAAGTCDWNNYTAGTSGSGLGTYDFSMGDDIDVYVEPAAGYKFISFSYDKSIEPIYIEYAAAYGYIEFRLLDTATLTANFIVPEPATLTIAGNPAGAAAIADWNDYTAGTSGSGVGPVDISTGDEMDLYVEPAEGYYFTGFTTDAGLNVTYQEIDFSYGYITFVPLASSVITANFAVSPVVTMASDPAEGGTTDPAGAVSVMPGEEFYAEAYPNEGYYLVDWGVEGSSLLIYKDSYMIDVLVNGDTLITAFFAQIVPAQLTIAENIDGAGAFDWTNATTGESGAGKGVFDFSTGDDIYVSVSPNEGYYLADMGTANVNVIYQMLDPTYAEIEFVLLGDANLDVIFGACPVLTTAANPAEGGIVEPAEPYTATIPGEYVEIYATANEGYYCASSHIDGNSIVAYTDNTGSDMFIGLYLYGDTLATVDFAQSVDATLTVAVNDSEGGTVYWETPEAGGETGTFAVKTGGIMLTPEPAEGYYFTGIETMGNITLQDDGSGTYYGVINGDATVTVNFSTELPGLLVEADMVRKLTNADGTLFFFAESPDTYDTGLYVSDGTPEGTTLIANVMDDGNPDSLAMAAHKAKLAAKTKTVKKSSAKVLNTALKAKAEATKAADKPKGKAMPVMDWNVYFFGMTDSGMGLMASDGTPEGTVFLKEGIEIYGEMIVVDDYMLFFNVIGDEYGNYGLWVSDGTPEGTMPVKNGLTIGTGDGITNGFAALDGIVYFPAFDESGIVGLWASDGTPEGTIPVKSNIMVNSQGGNIAVYDSSLLVFQADDEISGYSGLWASDGTPEGTAMIKPFMGMLGEQMNGLFVTAELNGLLYFPVEDDMSGMPGLWVTDGTADGTMQVKAPLAVYNEMLTVGDQIFINGDDMVQVYGLWKSDGTAEGTVPVKPGIMIGDQSGMFNRFTDNDGILFFPAMDDMSGCYGLFRSDGTTDGTFCAMAGKGIDNNMASMDSTVYFGAMDGMTGIAGLWKYEDSTVKYQLTVQASPAEGGITDPSGTILVPESNPVAAISAEAAEGYVFCGWTATVNATVKNPSASDTTVTLVGDAVVTALFAPPVTLTMAASPKAGGATVPVAGAHVVGSGLPVSIKATAAAGYLFAGWTADKESAAFGNVSSALTTVTISEDTTVTANFQPPVNLTMAVSPEAGGKTTPEVGVHPVIGGTAVNISATAADGFQFAGWTADKESAVIDDASAAKTTVTITENTAVTANFLPPVNLTMAVLPEGSGTTVPGIGTQPVLSGIPVDISVVPSEGYKLTNWTADKESAVIKDASAAETTVSITEDTVVTANLELIKLNVTFTAGSGGSISGESPQTVEYGASCKTVTAVPSVGYSFLKWTKDGEDYSTEASLIVTGVKADMAFVAHFEIMKFTITATAGANGTISPQGAVSVPYGTDQTFTITPADGYRTSELLVDGKSVTPLATYTFVKVAAKHTISANFAPSKATLTALADPAGAGTLSPLTGEYDTCTEMELQALPKSGYFFVQWTVDDPANAAIKNMYSAKTTLTIYKNAVVTAKFSNVPPGIYANYMMTLWPDGGGETSPAAGTKEKIELGKSKTITANPNPGYYFAGWSAWDGTVEFENSSMDVTNMTIYAATADFVTIRATFAPIPEEAVLTMDANPEVGGTTTPASGSQTTVKTQTGIPIKAEQADTWYFIQWIVQGPAKVANQFLAETTVTLLGSSTVTAEFSQTKPEQATLVMAVSPELGEGSTCGETDPAVGPHTVNIGCDILVCATASDGYQFSAWTLECKDTEGNAVADGAVLQNPKLPKTFLTVLKKDITVTLTAVFISNSGIIPTETKLSSTHKDYVSKEKEDEEVYYTQHSKDTYSISVKINLASTSLDLKSINAETPIEFTFGGLYDIFDSGIEKLGDGKFTPKGEKGGSSVFTIREVDDNNKEKTVEKITFKWNKKKELIITVSGKPLVDTEYNILDLSDAPQGDVADSVKGLTILFGDVSVNLPDYTVGYKGKKKVKEEEKDGETFDLESWNVKGKVKK